MYLEETACDKYQEWMRVIQGRDQKWGLVKKFGFLKKRRIF
jgi:hypothetical protein